VIFTDLVNRILEKLDSVSKGICSEEAPRSRNRVTPDDVMSGLGKPVAEYIDLIDDEGRVCLSLRLEIFVATHVDLTRTPPKPASAATLKPGRLLLFNHSEDPHKECASLGLLPGRHRE